MEMPIQHQVPFYSLSDVIESLTTVREFKIEMSEACSGSDFCFGTNSYSLVKGEALADAWYDYELYDLAEKLKLHYNDAMIDLEG